MGITIPFNAHDANVVENFSATRWTFVQGINAFIKQLGGGVFSPYVFNFSSNQVAGSFANCTANIDPDLDLSVTPGFWLCARVNFRQTATQVGISTYLSNSDNLGAAIGRFQATNLIYSTAVGMQPHWCPKTKFTVLDGTPTFALPIKSWRFRIDSSGVEIHNWDLLGITTLEESTPTILVTQDDGWDTSYTIAFPICQARGISQSHYLIGSLIGTAGMITLAQAQEMQTAGDNLGLHGALRWDLDLNRITTDIASLEALGIGHKHGAYPEGQIGDGTTWTLTEAALKNAGVISCRLAGGLTPTLKHRVDPYCLPSYPLNNSMTLVNAQRAVDAAIESKGTVIFYGHKYGAVADSLTWTTADFTALMDYIVGLRDAGRLEVKNIEEYYSP